MHSETSRNEERHWCLKERRYIDPEHDCPTCEDWDAEEGYCRYHIHKYGMVVPPAKPRGSGGKGPGTSIGRLPPPPIVDTNIRIPAKPIPLPKPTDFTQRPSPEPKPIDATVPVVTREAAEERGESYHDVIRDALDLLELSIQRSTAPLDPLHPALDATENAIEQNYELPDALPQQLDLYESMLEGDAAGMLEAYTELNVEPDAGADAQLGQAGAVPGGAP